MKFITISVLFLIFGNFSCVSSKTLKEYYFNKVSTFKGERKPLASPVINGIHDNYTRSKRQTKNPLSPFQDLIVKSKQECVKDNNMSPSLLTKSLMVEENPTNEEKCLMSCILKKCKLMDNNDVLSVPHIVLLAHQYSNGNDLVKAIAKVTAEKCVKIVPTHATTCNKGHLYSDCLKKELKMHKMKLAF